MSNKTLKQNKVQYLILYAVYTTALFLIFRNVFIQNWVYSFTELFGFKSRWYVYDPMNVGPTIPTEPGTEMPTYPDPDWGNAPITTGNYWQLIGNTIFRSLVILAAILLVIFVAIKLINLYDIRSKKTTTLPYKIYEQRIRPALAPFFSKIKSILFHILSLVVDRKNFVTMILMAFAISGFMPLLISRFMQSIIDAFIHNWNVWIVLHGKAVSYLFFDFIKSLRAYNIILVIVAIYVIVSFVYAYKFYDANEKNQEEMLTGKPLGIYAAGGSGKGKTFIITTLGSASHRQARNKIKDYLKDNESAYGMIVNFNDIRAYYNSFKSTLKNSVDCIDLAHQYIQDRKIKDFHLDRFLGRTPTLHKKLEWHFIGLWLIDHRPLLMSTVPMIINDNDLSDDYRMDAWDLLTRRHKDVYSLVFDLNAVKKTITNLVGKVDENGKLVLTSEEELQARRVFAKANFSLEPGVTLVLPELDKDFHNSNRGEIIQDGSDKLFAVLRHFIAFDNLTISHVFYDAQQDDGVAKVVRGRFDYVLYINSVKDKRSLFFVPYILYIKSRIKLWTKFRDLANDNAPYRKSFWRVIVAWRLSRLTRWYDYFNSFNYKQFRLQQLDSNGVKVGDELKLNCNLATGYYQYASTQYQPIYQAAKRKAHIRYERLQQWQSLDMNIDNVVAMNSQFVDSIVGIERIKLKKEEDKSKSKQPQKTATTIDFKKEIKQLKKGM